MQTLIGWITITFGGALYLAQIISSINFPLAQRLGIQERPETSDVLLQRSERYTAYWDLFTLLWLPIAGILMIIDHPWWPVIALIGGAIYLDAAGREAAKSLSFRHEGMRIGSKFEQRAYFACYIIMAALALLVIVFSVLHISVRGITV